MPAAIYLENTQTGRRYGVVAEGQTAGAEYMNAPKYWTSGAHWSQWLRTAVYYETFPGELADWPTIVACTDPVSHDQDGSLWCGPWHLYERK